LRAALSALAAARKRNAIMRPGGRMLVAARLCHQSAANDAAGTKATTAATGSHGAPIRCAARDGSSVAGCSS